MGLRRAELALSSCVRRARGPTGIPGTAPTFSPVNLLPLVWLDPTAGVYKEKSSPVTPSGNGDPGGTWTGRTGQSYAAAADANRPTWSYNGALSYLTFDGVDDYLIGPDVTATLAGNKPLTIAVATRTTSNAVQVLVALNNGVGAANTLPLLYWNGGLIGYEHGSSAGLIQSAVIGTGVTAVIIARYDGAFTRLRVNGVDSTPVAYSAANTSAGVSLLGALGNVTFLMNGRIGNTFVFNRSLSDVETTALAAWMAGVTF
jgi:hypothetical protein